MATVRIPTPMRTHTRQETVTVGATTVVAVLRELIVRYPGLEPWLDNGLGALPGYTHVFVGQYDIRVLDGLDTSVREVDEVHLIAEMSGG